MKWKEINWAALVGAVMLLVGFFLSWVRVEDIDSPLGGWELGLHVAKFGEAYYAAYAVPVLAVLLGVLAVKKPRWSTFLGLLMGFTALGWGMFEVVRLLYARTFAGLWVSVGGAALLFVAGLLSVRKARAAKKKSAGNEDESTKRESAKKDASKGESASASKVTVAEDSVAPEEDIPELTEAEEAELDAALAEFDAS